MKKDYPYLMCIDNDAMLDENAIGVLYDFMEEHPECGISCSKVYDLNHPDIVQQFGISIDFQEFCVHSDYEGREEDGSMPEYVWCDAVPACSMMIRRSVIDKIGILPQENFLYWDDTVWCHRCRLAGFRVACVGASQALHVMGARKESVNTFPTYYAWRNWLRFFMLYTPQESLENMYGKLLGALYASLYESLYNEEEVRATTVYAAYDDAIHGVTGKAAEGIIGPLLNARTREHAIVEQYRTINIVSAGFPEAAQRLLRHLNACVQDERHTISIDSDRKSDVTIVMCAFIFSVEDLSRNVIYADEDENILLTESDTYYVMNYAYGRDVFIRSQRELFARMTGKLRKSEKD